MDLLIYSVVFFIPFPAIRWAYGGLHFERIDLIRRSTHIQNFGYILISKILFKETLMPNTIELHRVIRAPAERIYRAFLTADAWAKWLPPHGFTGTVHALNPHVGGTYRMSFTNFTTGHSHSFGGAYLELVENARLRYSAQFDDPNVSGEMQTTVVLTPVFCGTEIHITQAGIPDVIPTAACYLGWQESLVLLAQLVEPEIHE